jgi:hypothetical protein
VDGQDRLSNMQAGQDSGQAEQYGYKQVRIVDEHDRLSNIQAGQESGQADQYTSRSGLWMNRTI